LKNKKKFNDKFDDDGDDDDDDDDYDDDDDDRAGKKYDHSLVLGEQEF